MAVKQINLDALIDNTTKAEVRIAGKVYPITINDEMFKRLTELQAELATYFAELEDISEEKFAEIGADGRKEIISNMFNEINKKMMATLDELLGQNEGHRLYERLGRKTVALSYLIGELRKIYTDSIKEKQKEEKKQNDRMSLYTKKKRKNRK